MRFRPEIDGLRALAVSLVILCHLKITGFAGGYIGVDIFFVISGLLITNLLINEYDKNLTDNKNGWISFRNFYLRRIKRIVPMALTVIIVALIYAHLNYSQARFSQVKNDAIWASLFGANIHFMHESLNYFQQAQAVSLLQHYWSLAVEEQFYLIFPALFLIFARIKTKLKSWLFVPLIAVSLLSLISLFSAITTTNSIRSYFSSFDRAYELGIGALLALVLALRKFNISIATSNILSSVGIVLIAFSILKFDATSRFPGSSALMPTIGAALILFSESSSSRLSVIGATLARKPIVYIGKLSYSIYLWHWLVIIIVKDQISASPVILNTLIILITLLLSIIGYQLIEHPIRRLPIPVRLLQPIAISARAKVFTATASLTVIALIFSVSAGWIGSGLNQKEVASPNVVETPAPITSSSPTPASSNSPTAKPSKSPTKTTAPTAEPTVKPTPTPKPLSYAELLAAFKEKVYEGNMLNAVPDSMYPTVSQLLPLRDAQWRTCMDVAVSAITCEFGNKTAGKTAVILGDSFALAAYTAILGALDLSQWHVVALNMRECMVADVVPFFWWDQPGGAMTKCSLHRDWSFDYLEEINPDLIFLSDQPYHPIAIGDKDSGGAHDQLWAEGLDRSLQRLKKLNSKIVYLGVPDSGWGTSLVTCTNAQGEMNMSCFGPVSTNQNYVDAQRYATEAVGGLFVDLKGWICGSTICPPIIDNTPVFYDGAHLSEAFGTKLAPLLAAFLREKNYLK
jgi:peptidoglycan/LPS O-acetylase OafA/YrhL